MRRRRHGAHRSRNGGRDMVHCGMEEPGEYGLERTGGQGGARFGVAAIGKARPGLARSGEAVMSRAVRLAEAGRGEIWPGLARKRRGGCGEAGSGRDRNGLACYGEARRGERRLGAAVMERPTLERRGLEMVDMARHGGVRRLGQGPKRHRWARTGLSRSGGQAPDRPGRVCPGG